MQALKQALREPETYDRGEFKGSGLKGPLDRAFLPAATSSHHWHFALISHEVNASRVKRHLPRELELDTFRDSQGRERAFVTVGCWRHHRMRHALLPWPNIDASQLTYRTYVRYRGYRGVYFFATVLDSLPLYTLQRATSSIVHRATAFELEPRVEPDCYPRYHVKAESELGETRFDIFARREEIAPESDTGALIQFLSQRHHGFMRCPGGWLGDQMVRHRRITPWIGQLESGRFELWERLKIFDREDQGRSPALVTVEPSVRFHLYPPFPARLLPRR